MGGGKSRSSGFAQRIGSCGSGGAPGLRATFRAAQREDGSETSNGARERCFCFFRIIDLKREMPYFSIAATNNRQLAREKLRFGSRFRQRLESFAAADRITHAHFEPFRGDYLVMSDPACEGFSLLWLICRVAATVCRVLAPEFSCVSFRANRGASMSPRFETVIRCNSRRRLHRSLAITMDALIGKSGLR